MLCTYKNRGKRIPSFIEHQLTVPLPSCVPSAHSPHPVLGLYAVNPGRSLFLLYTLKSSPRLGLLYLYLFDYTDTFLPFIHTICPLQEGGSSEDIITRLLDLREPTWKQWREFLVKYSFLPYQLIAEFAWDWLEVHYWTSRFLIVNAMLLSVLELFSFWRIWSRSELK
ncbi:bifunctional apoptosis regulator-like [Sus scrofa]|uniref:bifunctional apoptosis regulator-like n=1 Tax=Sus scrofa TaxID=9823 RepID=UPI000A2B27B2|nr:bifunctional apoptosis regulator-like [Sus scrofa]